MEGIGNSRGRGRGGEGGREEGSKPRLQGITKQLIWKLLFKGKMAGYIKDSNILNIHYDQGLAINFVLAEQLIHLLNKT